MVVSSVGGQTGRRPSRAKRSPATLRQIVMNLGGSVRLNPTGVAVLCLVVILLVYFNTGGGHVPASTDPVNLKQLLSVAIAVAEAGGREVVAVREEADIGQSSKGKTLEGADDPKTNGDMRSHIQMFYGLRKVFPNVNIISEEHDEKEVDTSKIPRASITHPEVEARVADDIMVPANEIAVWIDPLDATQEFTENLRQFVTTMVCIAVNGKPTIGVIHKPFEQETAWGWAGQDVMSKVVEDAAAAGKAKVNDDLGKARIIVSRSHTGDVNKTAAATLGTGIMVTPAGGAGYKTLEVVKGNQDAYIHTTLIKKWDICAGNAILLALKGKQTTLDGGEISYGSAKEEKNTGGLLATLHHHEEFLQKLSALQKP